MPYTNNTYYSFSWLKLWFKGLDRYSLYSWKSHKYIRVRIQNKHLDWQWQSMCAWLSEYVCHLLEIKFSFQEIVNWHISKKSDRPNGYSADQNNSILVTLWGCGWRWEAGSNAVMDQRLRCFNRLTCHCQILNSPTVVHPQRFGLLRRRKSYITLSRKKNRDTLCLSFTRTLIKTIMQCSCTCEGKLNNGRTSLQTGTVYCLSCYL